MMTTVEELEREVNRLRKINQKLMERVERDMSMQGGAFSLSATDAEELGPVVVAGKRALIVEASSPVRSALADLLRGFGVICDVVPTIEAAIVCLRAGAEGGARHELVFSPTCLSHEVPGDRPPAWIRLTREGEERDRAASSSASGQVAIELPRPIRRWRLLGALRHAHGVVAPARRPRTRSTTSLRATLQLRVLVAEDNLINQEVTLGMLSDLGCTALCVADGGQVLEALERESFDLILMDCQMPVMDGYEATRELRRREKGTGNRQIVVALTANASTEDREACRNAGMDDFLSKPFQRGELAKMLHRHARASAATAPADPVAVVTPPIAPTPAPAGSPLFVALAPVAPGPPPAPVPSEPPAIDPPTLRLASSVEPPSAIAVFDRGALDKIRSIQRPDRPDLATRVLTLYLERSPAQIQAIADAASSGDPKQIARAAHDLKGGSGNLGLLQIVDLLARIEQHGKRGDLAGVPALLAQLPAAHAAAMAAVQAELDRTSAPREPAHA